MDVFERSACALSYNFHKNPVCQRSDKTPCLHQTNQIVLIQEQLQFKHILHIRAS